MLMNTLRTGTRNGVGVITLTRAAEYNTITPELRDELAAAIDRADADREVRVILLRAEGRRFARATHLAARRARKPAKLRASACGIRSPTTG
jgi:enoyl-CoA hydratase/carnithine racemase